MRKTLRFLSLASLTIAVAISSGSAQTVTGCVATQAVDPTRTVYQCANGLVLEAETATAPEVTAGAGRPEVVLVDRDAVLIQLQPGAGPFEIRTPHAIAAVRGTEYIVDVTSEQTSVFVVRGEVAVSRANGSESVLLTAQEGVDVAPGFPFAPERWSTLRAEALLARFGQ
ncbi:FecR protein [Labrenzia sp. THAF82]|uniref:FecR domain-containing protein n=1 Tax=Labrenzia sp. THAF82 TaxID=2587861 RepID=UPI001267AD4B|nr:FecR domain-containing protein [Labrenzia sp. THAF82]QFT34002.1 FecR protein [Labrenzia sp. THAF82]